MPGHYLHIGSSPEGGRVLTCRRLAASMTGPRASCPPPGELFNPSLGPPPLSDDEKLSTGSGLRHHRRPAAAASAV